MRRDQVIKYLKHTQGKRTQKEFAAALRCSTAYLSDIYAGKRDPGPKVLDALGLKQEITYKRWR